jgi:type IV secretory pathway VirD2 relaxase
MVSLDAGERADLRRFLPRLMAQFEADIGSRVDWLAAVHHDSPHVHAHVVIRGVLPDGQKLYLTKSYWAYGFKYRAQGIATAMLGPMRRPMSAHLRQALGRLRERFQGQEISHA